MKILRKEVHYFIEIDSTNDFAFKLGKEGTSEGAIVAADFQTKGRGRTGKKWFSPPGINLYISVLLRPQVSVVEASIITLLASVAVVEAIGGEGAEAFIKWPNDVLIHGKKVSGILTESEINSSGEGVDFVVVGIGVNVNMTRDEMREVMGEEIAENATSLKEVLGHSVDRLRFAFRLLEELDAWYGKFLDRGKTTIIDEWTKRSIMKGKRVQVGYGNEIVEGISLGVDENGHLLVEKDDRSVERIISGEVVFIGIS